MFQGKLIRNEKRQKKLQTSWKEKVKINQSKKNKTIQVGAKNPKQGKKKSINETKKNCGAARDFPPSPSSNLDRGRGYSTPKPFVSNPLNDISRLELETAKFDRWISRAQADPAGTPGNPLGCLQKIKMRILRS